MPKLRSVKQEKFCLQYIKHGNGDKAAKEAGYSKTTSRATASKLLTKNNIQERLGELHKPMEKKAMITAAELKQWLTDAVNVDPMEFYEIDSTGHIVTKRLDKIKPEFRRLINGLNFSKTQIGKRVIASTLKIDIPNKNRIADMLNRIHGLYNDTLVIDSKVSIRDMRKANKSYKKEYE